MHTSPARNLASTYLRLKTTSADLLPVTPAFWPDVMQGKLGDFHHEYLVITSTHDQKWSNWELHPNGDEIIVLIAGSVDLTLDQEGTVQAVSLRKPGDFVLVEKGTWHTANPQGSATLLFITAAEGTTHRPT
jgi:mannose-6-phosphate isomerase-like protein (cupin superfamily)